MVRKWCDNGTMATNIRLSPALDSLARAYCDRVGISLNSLVGVALDAYLRGSQTPSDPPAAVQPVAPAPQPQISPGEQVAHLCREFARPVPAPKPKHPGPKARAIELHNYRVDLEAWKAANPGS